MMCRLLHYRFDFIFLAYSLFYITQYDEPIQKIIKIEKYYR